MAVIEVDGVKLDEEKLMSTKVACSCCRKKETRLILPTASWNTSGKYIIHCYLTGRMEQVDSIVEVLQNQGLLDQVKVE